MTTKKVQGTRKGNVRRNRKSQTKKTMIKLLAIVLLVCAAFVGGLKCSNVFAKERNQVSEQQLTKCYTTVQVNKGDTLWSIAENHMDEHYDSVQDYIREIVDINGLSDDEIHEDGYLTVAYYANM